MSSLQDLWAERKAKCESDQAKKLAQEKEDSAKEKAILKAKNEAKKAAILRDPKHPKAVQAKYAEECKKQLEEDKRHREAILRRAQGDRIARKEKDEQEKAIRHRRALALAQANHAAMAIDAFEGGARRMRSLERDLTPPTESDESWGSNEFDGEIDEDDGWPTSGGWAAGDAYGTSRFNGCSRRLGADDTKEEKARKDDTKRNSAGKNLAKNAAKVAEKVPVSLPSNQATSISITPQRPERDNNRLFSDRASFENADSDHPSSPKKAKHASHSPPKTPDTRLYRTSYRQQHPALRASSLPARPSALQNDGKIHADDVERTQLRILQRFIRGTVTTTTRASRISRPGSARVRRSASTAELLARDIIGTGGELDSSIAGRKGGGDDSGEKGYRSA